MILKASKGSLTGLFAVACFAISAAAQVQKVVLSANHDVSAPLGDIAEALPTGAEGVQHIVPLHYPHPFLWPSRLSEPDGALQELEGPLVGTTNLASFDGVSANGYAPPDQNLSVSETQVAQIVNVELAVYGKTGTTLLKPTPINAIWKGFGGLCETTNGGDPIVLYDKAAGRWLVSQLAYNSNFSSNFVCIAVSTTGDATGSYFRYAFDFGSNLPDYPHFGVWPEAYYLATNTFSTSGGYFTFAGANPCAFDRASMIAGLAASAVCIQQRTSVYSLLPSDIDGPTPPPSGEPNIYAQLLHPYSSSSSASLALYAFSADFTNGSHGHFKQIATLQIAPFSTPCGFNDACVPQPGVNTTLEVLADRLMYRLAYRNFGDHEALVVTHSVDGGTGGPSGVRWYEIRSPAASPYIYQQGTFAPSDGTYRWMGSAAMDKVGDLAVGYSASSSSLYPSVRYTGRTPADPLGTLESEASIIGGSGSQIYPDRWGDYSSMAVDPSDDCTFWYTNEYYGKTQTRADTFTWHTRIGSFKFNGC